MKYRLKMTCVSRRSGLCVRLAIGFALSTFLACEDEAPEVAEEVQEAVTQRGSEGEADQGEADQGEADQGEADQGEADQGEAESEADSLETATTGDTPEACSLVVFDPHPPLRVRADPSSESAALGELDNGTLVQALERREGYVRIASPVAGWVYAGMLMRACDAPPAFPALPLGRKTYLLLPSPNTPQAPPGTPLPSPATEEPALYPMRFSLRNARSLAAPVPVTLVTDGGSCERSATRRLLLIGTCANTDMGDYSTMYEALEVPSCPELQPNDPIEPARLFGLIGHHENARIEEWPRSEAPLTSGQRRVLERKIRRHTAQYPDDSAPPAMPETMHHFEGSRWSWTDFGVGEVFLLFHGDALMGSVDWTSDFPRRIRSGDDLLVGLGGAGHHGYGFYMFPDEARRGLVRELSFPTFSCAPN